MNRHSFFTTRLASASLLFVTLAGALWAPASVANARVQQPRVHQSGAAQEWLSKYYLPLPAPGAPSEVYPDSSAAAFADNVYTEVNEERTRKGLEPLKRNPHLDAVAEAHGVHMVQAKFFEHESPLGMEVAERIEAAGGPDWTWVGENIAAGYKTPEIAVSEWMRSKGHRKNILNREYVETGIGVLYDPRSPYGWYWVQVFATFDNHGNQVAWIEPQGSAPSGGPAVANSNIPSLTAVSASDATSDAPVVKTPPAPPASSGGNSDNEPGWTPAHPVKPAH